MSEKLLLLNRAGINTIHSPEPVKEGKDSVQYAGLAKESSVGLSFSLRGEGISTGGGGEARNVEGSLRLNTGYFYPFTNLGGETVSQRGKYTGSFLTRSCEIVATRH